VAIVGEVIGVVEYFALHDFFAVTTVMIVEVTV